MVRNILQLTDKAQNVWHMLHGTIILYKPPREYMAQTLHTVKVHLCRDLNTNLKQRPPRDHVFIEGPTNKEMTVTVGPSWADHPLLTGPRYRIEDVKMLVANWLHFDMSGILVVGIGKGTRTARAIRDAKHARFYRVKGILGQATDNYFINGKIAEKTTYNHVHRHHIDMICAAMQSSHQKEMFKICGVPLQSQAAYDLAVQGPIRPADNKVPMVYSIKCVDFKPPEFTLEIVCTNEDHMFLKSLVHHLGMEVRSTATCTLIQCVRFGIFNLEHALLKKQWDLRCITDNMARVLKLLKQNKFMTHQQDPILKEYFSEEQIESQKIPQIETQAK
ncbi:mitochondrial mRNA pseudouridine synthase Trub2 [Venturia canescens]|uniref:mitochondrial mRNA pseudouridine synthase Trub2 n=1 Tax=Venturia canescens TaxID=32260 RepID=UPI001C9C5170|nr:mitochondrial mRNA pseudouridine synthase Trub2 [Venturia canescens]